MHKRKIVSKPSKEAVLITVLVLFGLVAIGGILTSTIFKSQPPKESLRAEARFKNSENSQLKSKNYESYQLSSLIYAESYTASKDYPEAERVLNEVLDNVPEDKIIYETYGALSGLYLANGNKIKYQEYTKKLIVLLNKKNDTAQADFYKKQLKEHESK